MDLASFVIFISFPCLQIHQEVLAKGRAHIVWIIKVYKTFVILLVVVFKCFLMEDQTMNKACLSATALPSVTLTSTSASPSETFRPGCNLFSLSNLFSNKMFQRGPGLHQDHRGVVRPREADGRHEERGRHHLRQGPESHLAFFQF